MKFFNKIPWIFFWKKNEHIPDNSTVSRFRFFKPKNEQRPVPNDFMQHPAVSDMSVFETQHMNEDGIWTAGRKINPVRTLRGYCRMKTADIRSLENSEEKKKFDLLVKRSPETASKHSFFERWRHVNVGNCPHIDQEQYKLMAMSFVEIAEYISNPNVNRK